MGQLSERSPTWPEIGAALVVSTTLLLAMFFVGTERAGLLTDDAGQYARMAESPAYLARLPYTFRVLTPGLAAAWPGAPIDGFVVVTLVALALASTALYGYLRAVDLSHPAAMAGATLFALSGGSVRMLTTPTYVDSVTYLCEAVAFLALARGRFGLFLASVVIGVLNRETALLLIPLYFVTPGWKERSAVRALLVVGLPLGALAAVALTKLVIGGTVPLSVLAPFSRTFRQDLPTLGDVMDLYSTFGVMWLLATLNLPGPTLLQRRGLLFGALVIVQLAVSRGDEGRNLSHLFVLVIPLAMLEVERLRRIGGWRGPALGLLLAGACAASMIHGRWTWIELTMARYGLVALGTTVALALSAYGRCLPGPHHSSVDAGR